MAKSYIAEHFSGLAVYDLPAAFTREIGRILVRWAYFEHCVQDMCWQAARVSPAVGRIAIREPRVIDRLEMLNDLVGERGGTWNVELYKSILSRAKLASAKRDLLSHGVWGKPSEGEWSIQLTKGSWPKNLSALVRGSRRITPEGVPMDTPTLKKATSDIDGLIADLKELRASAIDAPPSQ